MKFEQSKTKRHSTSSGVVIPLNDGLLSIIGEAPAVTDCYIMEFEQNGEDPAAYGEQLLKKLKQRMKTKSLNERRFCEFRRLYLVYPQLKKPIAQYITSQIQIRQSLTAELQTSELQHNK